MILGKLIQIFLYRLYIVSQLLDFYILFLVLALQRIIINFK